MADNPLKSLVPKDPDTGPGIGPELGEKARSMNTARQALGTGDAPAAPKAPVGAPSPMKPVKGPYGSQPGEKRIDVKDMVKPLGTMHKGGTVQKTGPYVLKAGEKVLSPEQHDHLKSAMSLASSALSHEPEQDSEPKKIIRAMHIRKAADGTHVIEHHHEMSHLHPMEEHTAGSTDELHDHIEQHWGEPNDGEHESENEKDDSPAVVAMQKDLGYTK
jgi:hypothetical protein